MDKFPFEYIVREETKEIWILCKGSLTVMGVMTLAKKYFPRYIAHIASEDYFNKLRGQF